MSIDLVFTDAAPRPGGHYSQGIVHGGLVYVAGQLPIDPATGAVVQGDIEAQADRTLQNVAAILVAGGSGLDMVLSLTVYVLTRDDWVGINAACIRAFGDHRPARAVVGVANLKPGCRVEITAVAALRPG